MLDELYRQYHTFNTDKNYLLAFKTSTSTAFRYCMSIGSILQFSGGLVLSNSNAFIEEYTISSNSFAHQLEFLPEISYLDVSNSTITIGRQFILFEY